jgi:uncharacterized membrane protein
MAKNSKYDTNPLDPDFVTRADEEMEATRRLRPTDAVDPLTAQLPHGPQITTGRYEARTDYAKGNTSYPSVFVPPQYQPPAVHGGQAYPLTLGPPSSRPVTGLHLPEKLTLILPYAPAYIGLVAAIIELFLVPRSEQRVRFHAAQGLALQIGIIALSLMFQLIGLLTGSRFGGGLFGVAATVFLIVSMVRVWHGRSHHIAPLDEGTKWLNEHIEPRKQV